jgi:fructosamine-3-kinase
MDQDIGRLLEKHLAQRCAVFSRRTLGGGSISSAEHVQTDIGDFFMKRNTTSQGGDMFREEIDGLEVLRRTGTLRIPEVIGNGRSSDSFYLILEYIEPVKTHDRRFWTGFADGVAQLHRTSYSQFGYVQHNFIGTLSQSNTYHPDWVSFFIQERLDPLMKQVYDRGLLSLTDIKSMRRLQSQLDGLIPTEKPALLHGDLWSGNFLGDRTGKAVLFDPAVYYGHREMDIAMSTLFGGFDASFLEGYNESYPLQPDWRQRLPIHNLYPLLVHVALFGQSYVEQLRKTLNRYG